MAKENRSYLIRILNEKDWEKFKKKYKQEGLGNNINQSIASLIAKFVRE